MHNNSLDAYRDIKKDGSKAKRNAEILELFSGGLRLTDREVLRILKPGSDDMNYVRPRLSELIQAGKLKEIGKRADGGRNVRILMIKKLITQQDLF